MVDPRPLKAIEQPAGRGQVARRGGALAASPAADILAVRDRDTRRHVRVLKDLLGCSRAASGRCEPTSSAGGARRRHTVDLACARVADRAFGRRRDPFTGEPDFHPALDISADRGQTVYATAAGKVESAACMLAPTATWSCSTTASGSRPATATSPSSRQAGRQINRGDIVGYVGATGRATGNHLHYEVWVDGKPVNPLRLLAQPPPR